MACHTGMTRQKRQPMSVRATYSVWRDHSLPEQPGYLLLLLAIADDAQDCGIVNDVYFDRWAKKCRVTEACARQWVTELVERGDLRTGEDRGETWVKLCVAGLER
jgi:hypothetical protein